VVRGQAETVAADAPDQGLGGQSEELGDAFGPHGRLVVHPAWAVGPENRVRPWPSLIVVVLMVFCFFFPETNAHRPGRFACGRRTWVSVPSIRSVKSSASA
jgi:hypothetical protein